MKIIIKAKNLETSDSLNSFIEKKFSVLKKFLATQEIFIEVEKETNHHRKGDVFIVKAQVAFPGRVIMSDEKADDLFVAVIAARDELRQEIEKFKAKKVDKNRRIQRKAKKEIVK